MSNLRIYQLIYALIRWAIARKTAPEIQPAMKLVITSNQ